MTKDVEMKEAETVGANPTSTEEKVVEEATSNPRQVLKVLHHPTHLAVSLPLQRALHPAGIHRHKSAHSNMKLGEHSIDSERRPASAS